MDIPQGYKQTELGIIPEDWEVFLIGELGYTYSGLLGKTKYDFGTGNANYISFLNILTNPYINIKKLERVRIKVGERQNQVAKYDLFFNTSSETPEEVGMCSVLLSDCPNTFLNSFCFGYRLYDNRKVDGQFMSYFYRSKSGRNVMSILAQGATRYNLSKNSFLESKIALPAITEQQSIAEALSDIDGLIVALDKKIAKKRLIKQGAMQQLLTGKKRLPGFSDPWVEKKLGEIGYTYSGLTGKSKDDFGQGNAKYITFLNVLANPILKENLFGSITIRENEQQNKVQFGDLFFNTSSETPEDVGTCAVLLSYHEELYLNSFCFGYRLTDDNVLGLYLAYYFRSRLGRQLMTSLAQGATRYNLSKELFNASRIILPETKDEQIAIATILTDMDKEIDDLEAQRDKYRLLKSGMMQKLLMGQIRLTKPLTNVVPLVPGDSAVREIPVDAHIWAGHIVNRLWQSKGWGRTKLQKSLHLVGCYAQLDLGEEYIRNTAGPDDQRLMNYIDRKFKQYRHVNIEKERLLDGKIHYSYTPTSRIQEVEMAYERYPQDIRERVDNLLDKLNLMNLAEAEILSTLYAVWNNRIIKGERITDDLLVSDFYAWSEHKADFEERKVRRMLDYMCKENIVPIGWGKYIDEK